MRPWACVRSSRVPPCVAVDLCTRAALLGAGRLRERGLPSLTRRQVWLTYACQVGPPASQKREVSRASRVLGGGSFAVLAVRGRVCRKVDGLEGEAPRVLHLVLDLPNQDHAAPRSSTALCFDRINRTQLEVIPPFAPLRRDGRVCGGAPVVSVGARSLCTQGGCGVQLSVSLHFPSCSPSAPTPLHTQTHKHKHGLVSPPCVRLFVYVFVHTLRATERPCVPTAGTRAISHVPPPLTRAESRRRWLVR